MSTEILFAPRHAFLAYLAAGWRFANGIAEPMPGSHGAWSVMLERETHLHTRRNQ